MIIPPKNTILLVEDELFVAMREKTVLEDFGYQVIVADNGKKAIEVMTENNMIDLILMDLDLGDGMDGAETATRILEELDIPILMLSNHTISEMTSKTQHLSTYGYVVKNSGDAVLDASIKMALNLFASNKQKAKQNDIHAEIFDSMRDMFKVIELIYDEEGSAIDYYYLNTNAAFEKLTNKTKKQLVGNRAKEIFDHVENYWVEYYARVEKTGLPERYTNYGAVLDKSYDVYAWKVDDKQVAIIFTEISDIQRMEAELKEKTTLVKEVQHRTKNSIASIEGLISMQMNTMRNPEAISALQDTIARARSMRIIYDKLLLSDGYDDISVKFYTEDLIHAIISIFPSDLDLTLNRKIDDFILHSKIVLSIGIIINELLTNIMKYAFTDKKSGCIDITLLNLDNNIELTIHDNGRGLPKGFDINKSSGFGLQVIRGISEQLGGTFTIENDNGTKSVLKFAI